MVAPLDEAKPAPTFATGGKWRKRFRNLGLGLSTLWSHKSIKKHERRYALMLRRAKKAKNKSATKYWERMLKKAKGAHKKREDTKAAAFVFGMTHGRQVLKYGTKALALAGGMGAAKFVPSTEFDYSDTTTDPRFRRAPMTESTRAKVRHLIEVAVPKEAEAEKVQDEFGETVADLQTILTRLKELDQKLARVLGGKR